MKLLLVLAFWAFIAVNAEEKQILLRVKPISLEEYRSALGTTEGEETDKSEGRIIGRFPSLSSLTSGLRIGQYINSLFDTRDTNDKSVKGFPLCAINSKPGAENRQLDQGTYINLEGITGAFTEPYQQAPVINCVLVVDEKNRPITEAPPTPPEEEVPEPEEVTTTTTPPPTAQPPKFPPWYGGYPYYPPYGYPPPPPYYPYLPYPKGPTPAEEEEENPNENPEETTEEPPLFPPLTLPSQAIHDLLLHKYGLPPTTVRPMRSQRRPHRGNRHQFKSAAPRPKYDNLDPYDEYYNYHAQSYRQPHLY